MTTAKQALGSLPEIVEAIETAYSEARSFVSQLSLTRHYKVESQELTTLCVFVRMSDWDRKERLEDAHDIDMQRRELVGRKDFIRKHEEKLDQLQKEFGIASQRIADVCEFAYVDLDDFEDRSSTALQAINSKFWAVKRWIKGTIGFLNLADRFPVALSLEERQKIQDFADSFPIDQAFLTALNKRLKIEKSILTRNAKAFAESRGIDGSATTPQGRKKTEKTSDQIKREKAFLSLLADYEKWKLRKEKETGRGRFSPAEWLEDNKTWSSKSKSFFRQLCREADNRDDKSLSFASEAQIITAKIKYAQKLARSQSSGE